MRERRKLPPPSPTPPATGEPLLVCGNATKLGMLRPVQAARRVSTAGLTGITLYSPKELVLSARAGHAPAGDRGDPRRQRPAPHRRAARPDRAARRHRRTGDTRPQTRHPQTIGGDGRRHWPVRPAPRRLERHARPRPGHPRGERCRRADPLRRPRAEKRPAPGLDLCKLLTGSHGTLAVITEVTVKILPAPETTGSLVLPGLDAEHAVAALSAGLGSPYGVSGATWLPDASLLPALAPRPGLAPKTSPPCCASRILPPRSSTAPPACAPSLPRSAPPDLLDDATSRAESGAPWATPRPADPAPSDAVWRVSVRPSAGPAVLRAVAEAGVRGFLDDWGGGLV